MFRAMKISKTLFALSILMILSACDTTGKGEPNFLAPEANISPSSPSVNDRLALETGLEKIVYKVGPVDLPTGMQVEEMLTKPIVMNFQTDKPMWVVGFLPKMVDAKGNELPAELLHLAVISNLHEDNPLCKDAGDGNPFAAATSMLREINLPAGFGYPVLKSDPLRMKIILKNQTAEAFSDVYFELAMLIRPMDGFAELKDVKPLLVELDPCNHDTMSVAPGKFIEMTATYDMPLGASLVVAHAILGDFGSSVELSSGDNPEPFWLAEATTDENRKIVKLEGDPFVDSNGVTFKAGDSITMNVTYDNFSDEWLNSAPAAAMIYLVPES
jgi:hypothetical protein